MIGLLFSVFKDTNDEPVKVNFKEPPKDLLERNIREFEVAKEWLGKRWLGHPDNSPRRIP